MIRVRALPTSMVPHPDMAYKTKMATRAIQRASLHEFLSLISKHFGTKGCTVCEWLTRDTSTKLVLDFDHENSAHPKQAFPDDAVVEIRKKVYNGAMQIIQELQRQVNAPWEPRIVWLERTGVLPNGNYKVSIHVMVANAFLPWVDWGLFVKANNPMCPFDESKKMFDESIYSDGRCMVIPGACKGLHGDQRNLFVCTPDSLQDITPHPGCRPQEYADQCIITHVATPEATMFLELIQTQEHEQTPQIINSYATCNERRDTQVMFANLGEEEKALALQLQDQLNNMYGSGHRCHYVTYEGTDKAYYFRTDKKRTCAHGEEHKSNNCFVFVHSDNTVYYFCLAPSCKSKGRVEVGPLQAPNQVPAYMQMKKFAVSAIAGILTSRGDPHSIYRQHIRPILNRHFAVITASKTSYIELIYRSHTELSEVVTRTSQDFQNAFQNLVHESTGKNFLQMWLRDSMRSTYSSLVYEIDPSKVNEQQFNIFLGFRFEHTFTKQQILDTPDALMLRQDLKPILDHVRKVLCSDVEACATYFHKYLAHILQRRGVKTEVAVVLVSSPGVGKGLFVDRFFGQKILGRDSYIQVSNINKVLGKFNSCGSREVLVNLDEVCNQGKAFSLSDMLKSLITEPFLVVEKKGVDASPVPHFGNYIITTNHSYPVKIEKGDRRFFAVKCAEPPNAAYFDSLLSAIEEPKTALRYVQYLMSLDLENFHPQRDRPLTELYRDMMDNSKPQPVEFVCWLLDDGKLDGVQEKIVSNAEIYGWYQEWMQVENPLSSAMGSKLMRALNDHGMTTSVRKGCNKPHKVFKSGLKMYLTERNWYLE